MEDPRTGITTRTHQLSVTAAAEPVPALKYRFLPSENEYKEGNAATFYLKANGFFEQWPAHLEVNRQNQLAFDEKYKDGENPYEFLRTTKSPNELLTDEVKGYLEATRFQNVLVRDATQYRDYKIERLIDSDTNPISILLPEVQSMRQLARTQDLRLRVAIAENRIDDAFSILSGQYAMAKHVAKDDFLICSLVGIAIARLSFESSLYLSEHSNAPNLYWSYAALEKPFIDIRKTLDLEAKLSIVCWPALNEVDQTPRPEAYWDVFIERSIPDLRELVQAVHDASDGQDIGVMSEDLKTAKKQIGEGIEASFPQAKEYLLNVCKIDSDIVSSYPAAQVVILATKEFAVRTGQDFQKWFYVPFVQLQKSSKLEEFEAEFKARCEEAGPISLPTKYLMPALVPLYKAPIWVDSELAMLQTLHALRAHAAQHAGKLPELIEELELPAPLDPFTGTAFSYKLNGGEATLRSSPINSQVYELVISVKPTQF